MGSNPSTKSKQSDQQVVESRHIENPDVINQNRNSTNLPDMSSSTPQSSTGDNDDKHANNIINEYVNNVRKTWSTIKAGDKIIDEKEDYKPTTEFYTAVTATYRGMNEEIEDDDDMNDGVDDNPDRINKLLLNAITDSGILHMCDFVQHVFKRKFIAEQAKRRTIMDCFRKVLCILANFTDGAPQRTSLIRDHKGCLSGIASQLVDWTKARNSKTLTGIDDELLNSAVITVYNMSMVSENVDTLRRLGYKDIMIPYLSVSDDPDLVLTSLATLANMVDEKESEILRTNGTVLKFLVKTTEKAVEYAPERPYGWSVEELAKVIVRIAKNDGNKRTLVEHNVLDVLVSIAKSKDVSEQREAVKALWTLSFDEQNSKTMIEDEKGNVINTFITLRSSTDDKVKSTCNKALWTLREKLAQSKKYKDIGNEYMGTKRTNSDDNMNNESSGHVMISYQWSDQDVLKKVRDQMKRVDIRVWMDIDDMEGSTIDAMAQAVEDAAVVLVCVSKRYKDSDNCRAEAQYAWKLKKPIIPLIMERGYKPDGWIGIIVGAKLFFDFSGKYDFNSKIEQLIKELQKTMNKESNTTTIVPMITPSYTSAPKPVSKAEEPQYHAGHPGDDGRSMQSIDSIKAWTPDNVVCWLNKHNLPRKKFPNLSGIDVAFLLVLRKEVSGDYFYKTMLELLKISDLGTLSRLRFALDDTSLA